MHCPSVIEFTQPLQVHRTQPHTGFALESAAAQPTEIICRYVWQPFDRHDWLALARCPAPRSPLVTLWPVDGASTLDAQPAKPAPAPR